MPCSRAVEDVFLLQNGHLTFTSRQRWSRGTSDQISSSNLIKINSSVYDMVSFCFPTVTVTLYYLEITWYNAYMVPRGLESFAWLTTV